MVYLNHRNNASTTLASSISDSDTSFGINAGDGDKFPTSNFRVTIWNADVYTNPADDNSMEIIHVSSRSGDTFSGVTRGVEDTTASSHSSGHTVANLLTAGTFEDSVYGIKSALHEKTTSLSEITDSGSLAAKDEITASDVNTGTSTDGQVLTSNGSGSASWEIQTTLTEDEVEDIVGSLIVGGTSISVSYDDSAGTLTVDNQFTSVKSNDIDSESATSGYVLTADGSGGTSWSEQTTLTEDEVEDIVNGLVIGGSNITVTYDDTAGTLTVTNDIGINDTSASGASGTAISSAWAYEHENDSDAHHSRYTDAEAVSAVEEQVSRFSSTVYYLSVM